MKQLISNAAAAHHMGVASAIYQYWLSTGAQETPVMKVGGRVIYSSSDLDKWLDQHTYRHTGEYQSGGADHE